MLAQPTFPHLLVLPQQYFPVLVSHLDVPHWHALAFSDAPFVVPHGATSAHVFNDESQNNPVVALQSPVPHEHAAEFTLRPLVTEHGAAIADLLQRLSADRQKNPVVDEQELDPH